jgi:hypothetical protein
VEHLTDRVWLRSHEEEKGSVRVYRPEGFAFPPARGREGLVFHEDGRFGFLTPGRADRPGGETGLWEIDRTGGDRVRADVAGQAVELRIVDVAEDMLRLEWLSQ